MNIILFFTYDISLKDWETSGLLDRELKFYETLHKKYSTKLELEHPIKNIPLFHPIFYVHRNQILYEEAVYHFMNVIFLIR